MTRDETLEACSRVLVDPSQRVATTKEDRGSGAWRETDRRPETVPTGLLWAWVAPRHHPGADKLYLRDGRQTPVTRRAGRVFPLSACHDGDARADVSGARDRPGADRVSHQN